MQIAINKKITNLTIGSLMIAFSMGCAFLALRLYENVDTQNFRPRNRPSAKIFSPTSSVVVESSREPVGDNPTTASSEWTARAAVAMPPPVIAESSQVAAMVADSGQDSGDVLQSPPLTVPSIIEKMEKRNAVDITREDLDLNVGMRQETGAMADLEMNDQTITFGAPIDEVLIEQMEARAGGAQTHLAPSDAQRHEEGGLSPVDAVLPTAAVTPQESRSSLAPDLNAEAQPTVERGRREATMWIDRQAKKFVITLGQEHGMKAGDRLDVFVGSEAFGVVELETIMGVVSYARPLKGTSDSYPYDYYQVVFDPSSKREPASKQ